VDEARKLELAEHYNRLALQKPHFRKRNRYYYQEIIRFIKKIIPPGKKILEIGCADGYLLKNLTPIKALGLDLSSAMIGIANSEKKLSSSSNSSSSVIEFTQGEVESYQFFETYDYILLSDLVGDLLDIQAALENIHNACDSQSRLVIHYHNIYWEPFLKLAEKLKLKSPQLFHNWLGRKDIENFLALSDFELISFDRKILLPIYIPFVSTFFNRCLALLPLLRSFCFVNLIIARPKQKLASDSYSVSIIVPCRNEKGTIQNAIERLPPFGSSQEIIFIDGHSTDGTVEEIQRVILQNPQHRILFYPQIGKGKGDAVRLGFDKATKDILMILDSDLAVPPEDMPKFYNALATHKAEFANGSRLVYPMEKEAMRFLNILGNHFFSLALTWLLNQPLKDTLCGTKVLFKKDYEKIKNARNYFGDFDPFGDFDLLFGAVRQNLKIIEIPVRYRERVYGTTNISRFRHGLLLLKMVCFGFIKLKW